MSFYLKRKETLPQGVRRIVAEQTEKAVASIDEAERDSSYIGEAVHDVRKRCKKIRALLRLARFALPADYSTMNKAYRDLARQLAPMRDADAQRETIQELREWNERRVDRSTFDPASKSFKSDWREEAGDRNQEALARLAKARAELDRLMKASEAWRFEKQSSSKTLRKGLKKTYRRGRDARQQCMKNAEDAEERFHEWRKRVKYLRYQIRILKKAWKRPFNAYRKELHTLSDLLGDDHDLAVLKKELQSKPGRAESEKDAKVLQGLAQARQSELRDAALDLGAKCFLDKPKSFSKRQAAYWKLWRSSE